MLIITTSILSGLIVHLLTYAMLNKKAHSMPGSAVCTGIILSPWYVSVPFALVGHVISVILVKKLFENKNRPSIQK